MSKNISRENVEDILALTPLQQGMLFHYLNASDSGEYLEQLSLRLRGKICAESITKAWKHVALCNEMLRTVYRWDKLEAPVQIVQRKYEVPIKYIDIKGKDELERELLIKEVREKEREAGIDISEAPFKITVIKIAEAEADMIITNHHIIYDGWSNGIIMKEFIEAYESILEGKAPEKHIKQAYKEYVKWQQVHDNSEQLEYWRSYLEGYEEKAVISGRKEEKKSGKTAVYSEKLELESKNAIDRVCHEEKVSLATVINVSWGLLLQRYNNTEDVVFGTTVSGRTANIEKIDEAVGLYINTLPFRVKSEGKERIEEMLRRIEKETREREAYESISLAKLQAEIGMGRRENLFDTLVVIENYPIDKQLMDREGRVRVEIREIWAATNYDITVGVTIRDDIELSIYYKEGKYDATEIKRLTGHFKKIIEDIGENSRKLVEEIEMIRKEETPQLLYDFNNTYTEYPRDKTIHELFEVQAERLPDNIAVVYEEQKLTYRELNEKANQLAVVLRNKGVKEDSIVGLMVERSLEMIVGIMGILKAGGAYLPINPNYPQDRIEYMLRDSGSHILLTNRSFSDKAGFEGEVLALEDERLYTSSVANVQKVNKAADRAYIIYTSGSTGRPKGVAVEHKALHNFLCTLYEQYEGKISEKDKCLSLTNISFDVSVGEIFLPLVYGASLVLFNNEAVIDIQKLAKAILENAITFAYIPPTILKAVHELLVKSEKKIALNKLLVGVEPIKDYTLQKYMQLNEEMQIVNGYGPTEATICATMYKFEKHKANGRNVPIGKPANNTRIYILNNNSQLSPIGAAGEIYISGDGLARGYVNHTELTAERFISNPYEPGEKMYRTGDLARWLPDGNIEFIGRADHQVKIRGYRIELEEIENQILKHEAVKEAVVAAKEDKNGTKYLCAYLVSEKELRTAELREYLRKELPEYMLPSYFIRLDKMPVTPNGKIDRKALPEPAGGIETGVEYEAPRDEIEGKLASIWQSILKTDRIGIRDSFFDLGGHSLKATNLAAKLHKEFDVEVPLKEIFKTPTIIGLSEYIKKQEKSIYSSIEPVEEQPYYELASAQKRLYTLRQLELEGTSYNMPVILEVEGRLDAGRLEGTFLKLIERHEALRTSFQLAGNEIIQKVHKNVEFNIEHLNSASIEEGFVRAFDLGKAPLLRVGLVKVHPDKHILMFDMHHIISDGVSMSILIREFTRLYEGQALSKLKIQYKDYAAWQNKLASGKAIKTQEEYWLKVFEGEIPALNLPTDYYRPTLQSFEGDNIRFELDKGITEGLRRIAKKTGTTMYMVLLAGFNILLSKYSGQEDIVIGSPISGRPHVDLENIIGMFVNTLAMRNRPEGSKTISSFLEEVRVKSLKAYENQDYQFEELVERLSVKRDMSRNPLFDVMFVMQNMEMEAIEIEGLKFKEYASNRRVSKFDMTLRAAELGEKIELSLEYCSRLFNKETIERMMGHLKNVLKDMSQDVDKRISEIVMLEEEEKNKLLHEFNATYAEYPKNKTIHELFEKQVEKTPESIAVVYENKQLTYRELNERANQLAGALIDKGAEAENIVAIMVERSLEMIIGIMGILKAGCAYLPIDPEYPKERIQYMLEDSGASILITQKHLMKELAFASIEILSITDEGLAGRTCLEPEIRSTPDSLAYIIYTSGSTGRSKGVMIKHNSVINLVWSLHAIIYKQYEEGLNVALIAPYIFDASVKQIFASLLLGHSLHIVKDSVKSEGEELIRYFEDKKIDICDGTPIHLSVLTNSINERTTKMQVRHFIIGGEALSRSITNAFLDKFHRHIPKITNVYGPTECCVDSTSYLIEKGEARDIIPIGKPIGNMRAYIVDQNNSLQPIGVPGELCISGAGLARGYLNRQELTAEKFVQNPFEPETRMYKTGDIAKWLTDGNIEFLGRADYQVKIRGYRIELGEIENRLLSHEEIREAAVIAREDSKESKYLCAYISGSRQFTVSELREYLGKGLPEYMIPTYFVQIEKLPLTPNGKINRRMLPEPEGGIITGVGYEAPKNIIEEKLVKIWQEVLGIDRIGINDNFFELGGHSLKGMMMINRIHEQLNIKIMLQELFKSPTIAALYEYIKNSTVNTYYKIEKLPVQNSYELSYAQKRLWAINQLEPRSIAYNISGKLKLHEKIDFQIVKKVFDTIFDRHEALRTCFGLVDGEPRQIIEPKLHFNLEGIDLTGLDKTARVKSSEQLYLEEAQKVFDLNIAPLFRAKLVKFEEYEYELIFSMHHIISDGWSIEIMKNEFFVLYNAYKENKEINLSDIPVSYKDFAVWQNKLISDEIQSINAKEYWQKQLSKEFMPLSLPTSSAYNKLNDKESAAYRFIIDNSTKESLKEISKDYQASLFTVLLSAFSYYLSDLTGQRNVLIGIAGSGRNHEELKDIIGYFVNTIVLINEVNIEDSFSDFLVKINDNVLKALEYQNYPLELAADALKIAYPPISVFFNMLNIDNKTELYIEDSASYHIERVQDAKFDIACYLIEYANGIEISCHYIKSLFEADIIESMMKRYTKLLDILSRNPNLILKECNKAIKRKQEREEQKPANVQIALPKKSNESPLVRRLKEQFKINANNIAVKTREKELTYSMLDKHTGLICQGILKQYEAMDNDNEHIAALLFEHSADMIIATIGALISGKIYVPLDISYPEKRLLYMLENSEAQCIVTNSKNLALAQSLASSISREICILNIDNIDYSQSSEDIKDKVFIHKNQIAYLLYTSGSTGKPKGVIQNHENIWHFIESYTERLSIKPYDKMTLFSAFSHDAAIMDIYGGLLSGAALYPLNIREHVDMKELAGWIEREEITIWHSVPTLYRYFANTLTGEEGFNKLRFVVLGGESVLKYDVLKFKGLFKSTTLVNLYGQSESSYNSSYFINRNTDEDRIILGEPVKETKILVLDEAGEEAAPLSIGEIVIASRYVALGYWRNSSKTAEVFDFSNEYGRIYRTGDLGRIIKDDCIEFMGRKDSQIKIRGYRVELEEIESLLLKHKAVKEAVVLLKGSDSDEKFICAYFTADCNIEGGELRSYLSLELPEYMIPSYFIQLDKMPLTANGKLDRKALPEPSESIASIADYEAPRNEAERKLQLIWQEVLKTERNGINDSFLELGGNSLKAISMAAKIQKEFMLEIPLGVIIRNSTIKLLGEYIEATAGINKGEVESLGNKRYYPVSWKQKRMYILHQMEEVKTTYHNYSLVVNIKGNITVDKLIEALNRVISKYDTITASFKLINEDIVQLINEDIELKISYIEIEESMAEEFIKGFIKPFDLSHAPLFRIGLLKLSDDQYTLIIDMHKIISNIIAADELHNKEPKMWVDEFIDLIRNDYAAELAIQEYKQKN